MTRVFLFSIYFQNVAKFPLMTSIIKLFVICSNTITVMCTTFTLNEIKK